MVVCLLAVGVGVVNQLLYTWQSKVYHMDLTARMTLAAWKQCGLDIKRHGIGDDRPSASSPRRGSLPAGASLVG